MADASELRGNGSDVDPKMLFDDYTSTASPQRGFYPGGIDNNNGSIFYPVLADDTDPSALDTLADGDRDSPTNLTAGSITPASILLARMGKRLSESQ